MDLVGPLTPTPRALQVGKANATGKATQPRLTAPILRGIASVDDRHKPALLGGHADESSVVFAQRSPAAGASSGSSGLEAAAAAAFARWLRRRGRAQTPRISACESAAAGRHCRPRPVVAGRARFAHRGHGVGTQSARRRSRNLSSGPRRGGAPPRPARAHAERSGRAAAGSWRPSAGLSWRAGAAEGAGRGCGRGRARLGR